MPGGDVGGSVGGSTGGSGDGKQPGLPSSSSGCKQTAISGANKIIEQFPGKVREIGCIRQCSNPSSSDHCTGMATDMMIGPPGVSLPVLLISVLLHLSFFLHMFHSPYLLCFTHLRASRLPFLLALVASIFPLCLNHLANYFFVFV